MRKIFIFLLMFVMLLTLVCGCAPSSSPVNPDLDTSEPVVLKVVGPWEDFPALQAVAEKFTQKYNNCTIAYEYLQEYYASLETRLKDEKSTVDLFISTNIQEDSAILPYSLDLYSVDALDLSHTFEGLVHNFEFRNAPAGTKQIYAVPLGAEMRGMFVNTTLLNSLGLAVPTNRAELLSACEVLLQNGYTPMQGNPGMFAQQLMYPYVCNLIANADDYEATYKRVNTKEAGVSELFTDPMNVLYGLVEKNYYNYKLVENEDNAFIDSSNIAYARYFFNIVSIGDDEYVKENDLGKVAFMPAPLSIDATMTKVKSDYHSEIEYEFILAPVGEDSGYAYMSPAHGIGVNKNSEHGDWAIELFNFIFESDKNKLLAEKYGVIPNTEDAYKFIQNRYNISENHVSHVGEVTFDYGFYSIITQSLTEVAKANNPKYMQDNGDGTTKLYDFEYYMDRLEQRFIGTLTD